MGRKEVKAKYFSENGVECKSEKKARQMDECERFCHVVSKELGLHNYEGKLVEKMLSNGNVFHLVEKLIAAKREFDAIESEEPTVPEPSDDIPF
jgi:hypothetical protein